ncbi:MAG: hypothetical protein V9G09_14320 [Candidatus Nanopelagicales bacterium]|nr:hypothetical protein [Micrococcales bacterium]
MKSVIVAGVALLALAGCSSSDSEDSASSPAVETTSAAASPSPEASMIGPIIVEPSQTEVEATVGRDIVFNVGDDPGQWEISSDNEAVVSVEAGGERDGATFNPGAKALSVGEATVTLADQKGMDALQVTVTVTE